MLKRKLEDFKKACEKTSYATLTRSRRTNLKGFKKIAGTNLEITKKSSSSN